MVKKKENKDIGFKERFGSEYKNIINSGKSRNFLQSIEALFKLKKKKVVKGEGIVLNIPIKKPIGILNETYPGLKTIDMKGENLNREIRKISSIFVRRELISQFKTLLNKKNKIPIKIYHQQVEGEEVERTRNTHILNGKGNLMVKIGDESMDKEDIMYNLDVLEQFFIDKDISVLETKFKKTMGHVI